MHTNAINRIYYKLMTVIFSREKKGPEKVRRGNFYLIIFYTSLCVKIYEANTFVSQILEKLTKMI